MLDLGSQVPSGDADSQGRWIERVLQGTGVPGRGWSPSHIPGASLRFIPEAEVMRPILVSLHAPLALHGIDMTGHHGLIWSFVLVSADQGGTVTCVYMMGMTGNDGCYDSIRSVRGRGGVHRDRKQCEGEVVK